MTTDVQMQGGCLCGNVRYQINGMPFAAEYCHCRMCQKSVGSAVVNWMDCRTEQVTWTGTEPMEYASSVNVLRGFCPTCGSSISGKDRRHPEFVGLTIASLDAPDLVIPTRHIYTESQCTWLTIDDDCDRYVTEP